MEGVGGVVGLALAERATAAHDASQGELEKADRAEDLDAEQQVREVNAVVAEDESHDQENVGQCQRRDEHGAR